MSSDTETIKSFLLSTPPRKVRAVEEKSAEETPFPPREDVFTDAPTPEPSPTPDESCVDTALTRPVTADPSSELNAPTEEIKSMVDQTETDLETQLQKIVAQNIDNRVKRAVKAHNIVKGYAVGAMIVGVIPIPLVDMAALTGVQLKMVHSISNVYGVPFFQDSVKPLVSSLLGSALALTTAVPVSNLIKVIPGLGQAAGIASMVTIGGAATYAVGKVFVQHFESGGTFLDFDPETAKVQLRKFYTEAN